MGIFKSNVYYTCSKHNYTGINQPCPDCTAQANKLQEIWNYCDEEQIRWLGDDTEYIKGKIITLRIIQYMINKRCSEIKEPQNCD